MEVLWFHSMGDGLNFFQQKLFQKNMEQTVIFSVDQFWSSLKNKSFFVVVSLENTLVLYYFISMVILISIYHVHQTISHKLLQHCQVHFFSFPVLPEFLSTLTCFCSQLKDHETRKMYITRTVFTLFIIEQYTIYHSSYPVQ